MRTRRIAGVILLALGILGLIYGGFSYTSDTHDVELGPVEFTVSEKERVNVPVWAGVGGVLVGSALLFFDRRR